MALCSAASILINVGLYITKPDNTSKLTDKSEQIQISSERAIIAQAFFLFFFILLILICSIPMLWDFTLNRLIALLPLALIFSFICYLQSRLNSIKIVNQRRLIIQNLYRKIEKEVNDVKSIEHKFFLLYSIRLKNDETYYFSASEFLLLKNLNKMDPFKEMGDIFKRRIKERKV